MSATKNDSGKPSISLVPKEALWGCAAALTFGKNKYGQWNYKKGMAYTRLADAAFRHLSQFIDGEDNDPESGLSHLHHCIASIAMLIDCNKNHPENDDRYKEEHDNKS